MLSSPAAWVTTVPTPTVCTTCYECGPTPGSRAWQCKLRGVHLLLVFSPSIETYEHQRHKEQVARGEDAELRTFRRKEKTQEEDERHEAYTAKHESLVLGRTHSTSYIPWA